MKQKPENPIFVSKAEERRYLMAMKRKKLAEQKKPKCLDPKCQRCYPDGEGADDLLEIRKKVKADRALRKEVPVTKVPLKFLEKG